ncbi:MAG: AI-2E family transporter [Oscillospiraceae bacterium]|nr:AI-2E family transporter [Oscillospiraceae bacterium]
MELNKKTVRTLILGAVGCIVLYWLLHETERITSVLRGAWAILSPFVIGAAIAFVINVPMRAVERQLSKIRKDGFRRALAIFITLVLILLVLAGIVCLLIPQLGKTVETLVEKLPVFFNSSVEKINIFLDKHPELLKMLRENTDLENIDRESLIQKAVALISDSLHIVAGKGFSTIIGIGNGIFNAVISVVFALYCLARKEILARQFRRLLYALLPERVGDEVVRVMRMTNTTFSNFISGQCLDAFILGLMFAICMPIFRMPYMPLVSVIIAITALVPIVGAFAGCFIGAFFILVDSPLMAVWFVVMFLILQQIEGNLIYPRVVGSSVGLPGMWVLLALSVGGGLMGIGGMLLMIPVASVLYALTREFANKRLKTRNIDPDKLRDHPPELKSGFKANRDKRKMKFELRKMLKKEKKNK